MQITLPVIIIMLIITVLVITSEMVIILSLGLHYEPTYNEVVTVLVKK